MVHCKTFSVYISQITIFDSKTCVTLFAVWLCYFENYLLQIDKFCFLLKRHNTYLSAALFYWKDLSLVEGMFI